MGTTEDKKAPWETYNQSLTERLDPKLQAEVEAYSQKRHEKSSTKNEEELARWKEGNRAIAKDYQFLNPDDYADEGSRIGKIIHASQFIKMLKQDLNVNCFYRAHPHQDKLTLVIRHDSRKPEVGCWVANGYMIEYTIPRFDEYGNVLNEKYRGWRTCLLQLILKGIISEEEAHSVFGKASGVASKRYNSQLYDIRNHYAKVV